MYWEIIRIPGADFILLFTCNLNAKRGVQEDMQSSWETVNRSREGYIRPLMPVCTRKC